MTPGPDPGLVCCADSVFNACIGEAQAGVTVGVWDSNAYFKSCTFRGLSDDIPPESPGTWEPEYGAIHVSGLNASLVLDNCTISDIVNPEPIVFARGAYVFSDSAQHTVRPDPTG